MTEEYKAAYKALYDHVLECPDCLRGCSKGDALRQAVREAR
ncbi:hypothetical protein ACF1BS_01790 [Streptomyces sp. NPDC014748]